MLEEPTAVVLAAGTGSRLLDVAIGTPPPKPLRAVQGATLLSRTLSTLADAGLRSVVLVLGFRAAEIEEAARAVCPPELQLAVVINDQYRLSNGVSLLAARSEVLERFLLLMADHVLEAGIVELALGAEPGRGVVLCVDRKLDTIFDLDDATKVRSEGDFILAISKTLTDYDAIDTGVFHCHEVLFGVLDEVMSERGDCSISDGVARLAERGRARALDIGGLHWQDVDTPEMLQEAELLLRQWG